MGHDPAVAMVSVLAHPEARLKDTANNILETKEFVINLVSETVAEAMNITCIDAPPGTNELELANLKTAASVKVKPPRAKSRLMRCSKKGSGSPALVALQTVFA
jgi:flavin reductase (DIM6/NTAB) family NADH-FMN oxidoreductase RutF